MWPQAGVAKLNEAKALVDELKRRAAEQSILLKTKQAEADAALQEITTSMQVCVEVCVKSPECICDPCWQNECECACSNFELQAKEVKNVSFGQIWGFHKNEFIALF